MGYLSKLEMSFSFWKSLQKLRAPSCLVPMTTGLDNGLQDGSTTHSYLNSLLAGLLDPVEPLTDDFSGWTGGGEPPQGIVWHGQR